MSSSIEFNKSNTLTTFHEVLEDNYTFHLLEYFKIAILIIGALGVVISLITFFLKHLQLKNQEFKVLVTGLIFGGKGDYAKQTKVCEMLQSAGYICKILYSGETQRKSFLNFISRELLLENKGGNVLTFSPDLVIYIPLIGSSESLYAQTLNIPVLGIHEYGCKFDFPIENCKNVDFLGSGMEGLGIILESPYKKTYADLKEHLTNLPKIYQTAIYGEDFETFRGENDFFFGYANNPMNLVSFMMGVVHQRLEEITQKKLSFFFIGGHEFFPGCHKLPTQEALKQDFYLNYPHLNVKSILVKTIDEKNCEIKSYSIVFEKNPNGIEIEMVSARIENKYVYPLIHAAEETYSTGDESLSEVYSCNKVPLLYECLPHKSRLRKMQLRDIFGSNGKYTQFENNVMDMDYKQISLLLTAKKDPEIQKRLAAHLTKVNKQWNFRENFLKKVKSYARKNQQSKDKPLIMGNDFRIWPIGKKFYCPLQLVQLANIDLDGLVREKADDSNREIYEQWKTYTFKYEKFDDGYLLEITPCL